MKIIARIKGGLGNQLFCYAAARRLALVNRAELVIDDVSGFVRDHEFKRQYSLDHFHIPCRKAFPSERLEPFSRLRRYVAKKVAPHQSFERRMYIEQEFDGFDERLIDLKLKRDVYLDGLWQDENYFKDVAKIIRNDLKILSPSDPENIRLGDKIRSTNAIALHVRWFDSPGSQAINNISKNYYQRAISLIEESVESPYYYLFSDNPKAAIDMLDIKGRNLIMINHNKGDENSYADLWLMTLCQHYITANSTFSWWGAWLSQNRAKIVLCPDVKIEENFGIPWSMSGQLPDGWYKV